MKGGLGGLKSVCTGVRWVGLGISGLLSRYLKNNFFNCKKLLHPFKNMEQFVLDDFNVLILAFKCAQYGSKETNTQSTEAINRCVQNHHEMVI